MSKEVQIYQETKGEPILFWRRRLDSFKLKLGGQHACSIARSLGMKKVYIHRFAGILSAYGLGLASVVSEGQEPCAVPYSKDIYLSNLLKIVDKLQTQTTEDLMSQGYPRKDISSDIYLNLRYEGTDTANMTKYDPEKDFYDTFIENYKREYGFVLQVEFIMFYNIGQKLDR